jgi:hypothetical protein
MLSEDRVDVPFTDEAVSDCMIGASYATRDQLSGPPLNQETISTIIERNE